LRRAAIAGVVCGKRSFDIVGISCCVEVMQSVQTWCGDYQDNIEVDCSFNKRKRFERDIDSIDR
jgi:hypothetical protein